MSVKVDIIYCFILKLNSILQSGLLHIGFPLLFSKTTTNKTQLKEFLNYK